MRMLKVGDYVTVGWTSYLTVGKVIRVGSYDRMRGVCITWDWEAQSPDPSDAAEIEWYSPAEWASTGNTQHEITQQTDQWLRVISKDEAVLLLLTTDDMEPKRG